MHTVGGVISAGEPVMLIVPSTDLLTIEVRVAPADIDQVEAGQKSVLRFPAFNQRTTPELAGSVTRVAADLTREAQRADVLSRASRSTRRRWPRSAA